MASVFRKLLLSFIFFSTFQFFIASSHEFEVGGDDGWNVPSKHDDEMYNNWASKNRFEVNDTLCFKYEKDSVMVVSEGEYQKCRSSHPLFFFNNGDTVFKLDRPGLFYFISGISGHCERGQKMIIKVLLSEPAPLSQNQNSSNADSPPKKNGAAEASAITSTTIAMLILSFSGFLGH